MTNSGCQHFFDESTNTISYVVFDPDSKACVIIDPVLDYCAESGAISNESVSQLINYIYSHELKPCCVLETHIHADHLSASQVLKREFDIPVAIGDQVSKVQNYFNHLYGLEDQSASEQDFDILLSDLEKIQFKGLKITAYSTPGHTPACFSYLIGDRLFVGDTLFMPDYGTARCDFPAGDAGRLFDSIQLILSFPDTTKLMMCHDYLPGGRDLQWQSTVATQKANNIHIHDGISKEQFIQMRETRDRQLSVPKLLLPAIQVNIKAGKLPQPETNGIRYLKIPIDQF